MRKLLYSALLVVGALLLNSCADPRVETVAAPVQPLSCIAVLPAISSVDTDDTLKYEQAQALEQGAEVATQVLAQELGGMPQVHLLSQDQVTSLVPEITGGASGTVAAIGKKLNCDGVLVTTVRQYKERAGTELASEAPASVEVQMLLRHASSGAVLWATEYRETQESLLENIFSLSKVQKRGLKWVSAETLMTQGIQERLAESPYFK